MRIDLFQMERTQCLYEHEVEFNLSESGVLPLRVEEILQGPKASTDFLSIGLKYPESACTASPCAAGRKRRISRFRRRCVCPLRTTISQERPEGRLPARTGLTAWLLRLTRPAFASEPLRKARRFQQKTMKSRLKSRCRQGRHNYRHGSWVAANHEAPITPTSHESANPRSSMATPHGRKLPLDGRANTIAQSS